MDENWRKKVSEGRKKFLKENPELHPWKRKDKFKSKPCEVLKSYLSAKGLIFIEEWQPLEERFFSIDIAFPDIKLGIEVNGNQHYDREGKLNPYYQERHDLICAAGWTLIELHYVSCYNIEQIGLILDVKEQPDYSEYFRIKEEKILAKSLCVKVSLPPGQKFKQDSNAKWEPFKEIIIESGIDFSKFGWVGEVSKILGISSQKVNGWMKRYLPEVYEKKCFKRSFRL